jgi:Xaa-Pro aminopeptidase
MNIRIKKLISVTNSKPCLITGNVDLFYLTGIEMDGYWLLVAKGKACIFTSSMLASQAGKLMPGIDVISGDNMLELLMIYCKNNKISEIGVNSKEMTYSFGKKIDKKLNLNDISETLADLRLKKDAGEIKNIRKSCHIASLAVEYAKKLLKPGLSEIDIYFKIEEFFAKNGVKQSFPTIVASGPNSALPHHVPTSRKIQKNDTVLIDLGCVYKGYCSDLTRTLYLGKINKSQNEVYSLVKKAYLHAIKAVRNGTASKTIDFIARNVIEKGGYADKFIHTTGHGVGIEIHEQPRLSKIDKTILKTNMVVTVEPGIYLKGRFGVRIEDTLLVTGNGSEILTR